MWRVIAEEGIRCAECGHAIPPGAACLSQMPPTMPEGFLRRKYDNFCLECEDCNADARASGSLARPCYARWLNHWYAHKEKTREPVECAHCKEAIPAGSRTAAQKFYAWPDSGASAEPLIEPDYPGGAAAGAAAGVVPRLARRDGAASAALCNAGFYAAAWAAPEESAPKRRRGNSTQR